MQPLISAIIYRIIERPITRYDPVDNYQDNPRQHCGRRFTVDRDWNITSLNLVVNVLRELTPKIAIGQKCFDVFHANICQTACALKETLKTGKEIIARHVNTLNRKCSVIPVPSVRPSERYKGQIIGALRLSGTSRHLRRRKKCLVNIQLKISSVKTMKSLKFSTSSLILRKAKARSAQGESGTGKELFARAIHNLSKRKKGPFIALNCGALPDNLLESELFGYKKGAFTDAKKDKPGRFALAEAGTLFLDEIGDLSVFLQSKLLRVLQEKEYEPLGATSSVKANVRIITATNKNLSDMVVLRSFREDLFYRLNIVKIELPPLRRRKEDIPLLSDYFLKKMIIKTGKNISSVSDDVIRLFMSYDFPGKLGVGEHSGACLCYVQGECNRG